MRAWLIRSACLAPGTWSASSAWTASASSGRVGHQDCGGLRIVLGLGDEVGGDVDRVGGPVGQHGDLGRPGLGVDDDLASEQSLGGDHVDVAGPADQVHRRTKLGDAVREHGDRLGPADGVHLRHAEQVAQGEHVRVRQAAELPLRWRRQRDRTHSGHLGRDDVHDHAGGQGRKTAGHVEPDPAHRNQPLTDLGARSESRRRPAPGRARRCSPSGAGRSRSGTQRAARWSRPSAAARIASGSTRKDFGTTWSKRSEYAAIAAGAELGNVVTDGPDDVHRGVDVELRPRHQPGVVQLLAARPPAAHVDHPQHAAESSEISVRVATMFPGFGTLVNVATVLLGAGLGLLLGHRLPERTRATVTDALGLVTLLIGALAAVRGHVAGSRRGRRPECAGADRARCPAARWHRRFVARHRAPA